MKVTLSSFLLPKYHYHDPQSNNRETLRRKKIHFTCNNYLKTVNYSKHIVRIVLSKITRVTPLGKRSVQNQI